MIVRPTTDQLLLDCCRELTDEILPAIIDDTVKLRLIMAVTVLGNAAVRAAHEIAWMREETETTLVFAREVAATQPDERIAAAIDAVEAAPRLSLHLADVVAVYERAGETLAVALQVAHECSLTELIARAAGLLRARVETEKLVMADYAIVGR
jgi:hypothetical protein